jgi:hypothetical protein
MAHTASLSLRFFERALASISTVLRYLWKKLIAAYGRDVTGLRGHERRLEPIMSRKNMLIAS